MTEIRLLRAWVWARVQALREDDERGFLWVYIAVTALVVAAAIVIVGYLVTKGSKAAQNVKLQ